MVIEWAAFEFLVVVSCLVFLVDVFILLGHPTLHFDIILENDPDSIRDRLDLVFGVGIERHYCQIDIWLVRRLGLNHGLHIHMGFNAITPEDEVSASPGRVEGDENRRMMAIAVRGVDMPVEMTAFTVYSELVKLDIGLSGNEQRFADALRQT